MVYLRPRYLQARRRQRHEQKRRASGTSSTQSKPAVISFRALFEAVFDGGLSDEEDFGDEECTSQNESSNAHEMVDHQSIPEQTAEPQKEAPEHPEPLVL